MQEEVYRVTLPSIVWQCSKESDIGVDGCQFGAELGAVGSVPGDDFVEVLKRVGHSMRYAEADEVKLRVRDGSGSISDLNQWDDGR